MNKTTTQKRPRFDFHITPKAITIWKVSGTTPKNTALLENLALLGDLLAKLRAQRIAAKAKMQADSHGRPS